MRYCHFPKLAAIVVTRRFSSAASNVYFWTADDSGDGSTASCGSGIWDKTSSLSRKDTLVGSLATYPASGSALRANLDVTADTVTLPTDTNLLIATATINNNSDIPVAIDAVLAGNFVQVGLNKPNAST